MSALELFATGCAFLLPIAFSPSVFASFWTPKAAILVIVAGVGLPQLLRLTRRRDAAATAAALFLAWSAITTGISRHPVLSLTGSYNAGTGLLFLMAVVGAWALGRCLGDRGRSRAMVALLVGLAITAIAAVAQTVLDLSSFQLGRSLNRADAFMGNPVHLGAAMAGAIGAASWYWVRNGTVAALLGITLFGAALQLSGSRFALVATVLAMAAAILRSAVRRAAVASIVLVAGIGLGSFVATFASAPTGTTRVAAEASSGFTPRVEMAKAAMRAIADRPVAGFGPGRFREATGPYRTLRMARSEGPDRLFTDAHNVLLELAVTTGVVGLALAAVWLGLSIRAATGPAAAVALGVLVLTFVQPLNVSSVPLGMLSLGCSLPRLATREPRRAPDLASAGLGLLAVVAAVVLLLGDFHRVQAFLDFDRPHAEASVGLIGFWPEPHQLLSKIALYESITAVPDDPDLLQEAIRHQDRAADADPGDPQLWNELGLLELRARDFDAAQRSFRLALRADPQSLNAWVGVGQAAMATGRFDLAVDAFEEASTRAVSPEQIAFVRSRLRQASSAASSN